MNFNRARLGLFAIAFAVAGNGMVSTAAQANEFSFTASNSTNTAITEILVSENKSD